MKPFIIHVPHASMYIPSEYRSTALITQDELEEENQFMCDTGVLDLIPQAFARNTLVFPYSRLYCDVERFRDGSEPMEKYGMGYIYTHNSKGEEMFSPSKKHITEVNRVYDDHHAKLNKMTDIILREHGQCLIIDLHSFSDETVSRLFGYSDLPDVCIGTESEYHSEDVISVIKSICEIMDLSMKFNYPYKGSIVPNKYYGKSDTGIVSVMIEINKRVIRKVSRTYGLRQR